MAQSFECDECGYLFSDRPTGSTCLFTQPTASEPFASLFTTASREGDKGSVGWMGKCQGANKMLQRCSRAVFTL